MRSATKLRDSTYPSEIEWFSFLHEGNGPGPKAVVHHCDLGPDRQLCKRAQNGTLQYSTPSDTCFQEKLQVTLAPSNKSMVCVLFLQNILQGNVENIDW